MQLVARAKEEPLARRQGGHANGSHNADLASLMPQVARLLCGEPNAALSSKTELRYGSQGSLSISLTKGTWYDHEQDQGGGVLDLIARETGRERMGDCLAWLRENGIEPSPRNGLDPKPNKRVVARYDYRDATGALRYQVERLEPKTFRQRRPSPSANGDWLYDLKGVEPLPYRLPEVCKAIACELLVVIVEGEKDADALAGLGMVGSCNSGGAGKWQPALTQHFKGAQVVIIGDNDPAGRKHMGQVADALVSVAASVSMLDLSAHWPECPDKGDISDWIAAGGTPEQLTELLAKAVVWSPEDAAQKKSRSPGKTPKTPKTPKAGCSGIRLVRGERARVVDEALRIISDRGDLFERGGELVRVAGGGVEPVADDWLLDYLDRNVNFIGVRRVRDEEVDEYRDAPEWLARRAAAKRMDAVLRPLRSVITAPTMRRNGTILDCPGYDAATGLYLLPGEWPRAPSMPTTTELKEAAETIWRPFAEFPFVDDVARGVMLSTMLTAVIRQSLDVAPGSIFDAPAAGTGKTLLGFCVQALTGMPRQAIPECRDEDELRKRLLATLRTGQPCLLLDNIRGQFGSASLEAMLTTDVYSDRLLGGSRMLSLPTSVVVLISGNNFRPVGDLWRRFITVRMDAGVEAPERRSFSLEPFSHCRDNRQKIVAAALNASCAGLSPEGSPRTTSERLASFEDWDSRVRQAVLWLNSAGLMPEGASVADPVGSIESAKREEPERQKLAAILVLAHRIFGGDKNWRVADLVKKTQEAITQSIGVSDEVKALHHAVMEIAGERGQVNSRVLGRWIERYQMRRCGGLWIERNGDRWNTALWRVCGAPAPEAAATT